MVSEMTLGNVEEHPFQLGCRTSKRLPLVDALIAAAAQALGACLVHRDEHLAAIPAELVQQLRLPDPVFG